ncbi:hypothetical protein BDR04DRAFT_749739 [Suillus decipiens]|nr:hypothetical protein BDR04DRAFT_749739 [Suillus decipiens]
MHYPLLVQTCLVSICRLTWLGPGLHTQLLFIGCQQNFYRLYSYSSSMTAQTVSANFVDPPLLFTRVCCHWRDVAHSMPEIWSRIKVMLPGPLPKPLRKLFSSLLQSWLAWPGNLPLTICIEHPFAVSDLS